MVIVVSEEIEVKVTLSKKVYDALEWYLKNTAYKSMSEWIADVIEDNLEAEVDAGAPLARDFIADELAAKLGYENKVV